MSTAISQTGDGKTRLHQLVGHHDPVLPKDADGTIAVVVVTAADHHILEAAGFPGFRSGGVTP
ncbi:MAG: hypothetical protein VKI42_05735 [Synechococcaceae cyanobacterium]|nr:hypothetical protein [Synechococcaceae cyanobacterium]